MNLYRSETFTCRSKDIMHQKLSLMFKMMMQKSVCVCSIRMNWISVWNHVQLFLCKRHWLVKELANSFDGCDEGCVQAVTCTSHCKKNWKSHELQIQHNQRFFCTVASHLPHSHPYHCNRKNQVKCTWTNEMTKKNKFLIKASHESN